ncbi:MAG: hypothetical protein LIO41_03560 [Ruminococcus sp.]|nr:hypothetical protein [Ruminococcus sp.]
MKEKYTKVANEYFADVVQYVIILTVMFVLCAVLAFIINGMKVWNLLLVAIYLLLMAVMIKPFIAYFKSDKDLSSERFVADEITILSVRRDKAANLYIGDGLSGNVKYILTTDKGEFLLSEKRRRGSKKLKSESILIKGASFNVVYLENSRILVDVTPTTVFESPDITERYNSIFYMLYKYFKPAE